MQFRIRQTFEAEPEQVMQVFADPGFYPYLHNCTKIGQPEVLDRREEGGQVLLWVRYRFLGELNAAVRKAIDPVKLTWVEASRFDFATGTVASQLLPDHYADRMTCTATVTVTRDPTREARSTRTIDGDLTVRVPLVGSKVEHAIVSGLREHAVEEQPIAAWWLTQLAATPASPSDPSSPEMAPAEVPAAEAPAAEVPSEGTWTSG